MPSRDEITFEIPQEDAAKELCELLQSSKSYLELKDDAWSVQAVLGTDPKTVALLLRRVEAWVAERELRAIRFQLDDRWYVMESGDATWAVEAA
jgi:hypothetical protein